MLTMGCFQPAWAAAPLEVLRTDLAPLIDQVAHQSNRFAVDIPHQVTASTQGQWESSGATRRWTYSVQIPTAVSMSFHASRVRLPPSAVLTVSGGGFSATYRARDVNRGGLWARPLRGDELDFSLSVAATEAGAVLFDIASLQAGYRGLGGGVPDHPHYKRMGFATAAAAAGCTENYACNASTANRPASQATLAVLIGNLYQCTGTLLNNTRNDGTPYVLTARHCENGELGGGNPGAAASVTIYWDAVTPCGTALGSLYEGTGYVQGGATTVVEQQDAWLIRLDAPPVAPDAYYAGWDATGSVFTGGYSIHHALGLDKQYTGWFGQAILQHIPGSTLKVGYTSDLWGVVNQLGNVGAGASGGALFDPANRVVGNASLAQLTQGENSAGVCPVSSPPAPSPSTVTAQYIALASVWNSTADSTSTTGSTTLQSVLDPDGSGQLAMAAMGVLPVTLSYSRTFPQPTGQPITLTWNSPEAQTCTATGGAAGDGWSGVRAASGSFNLTEQTGGTFTYSLTCTVGDRIGRASVSIDWEFSPIRVNFDGTRGPVVAGASSRLQWATEAGVTCTASGGISGDGWAGSKANVGSQDVVASVIGNVTYSLTCGSGPRATTAQLQLTVVGPAAGLFVDFDGLRVGELINLGGTMGGQCTPSGGAPGDGWVEMGSFFAPEVHTGDLRSVTINTAGTYTYTFTCVAGGQTVSASTLVTVTNDPPMATLTASPDPQELPPTFVQAGVPPNLTWTSNVRNCRILYSGPDGQPTFINSVPFFTGEPRGSVFAVQRVAGHYTYTLTCGISQTVTSTATLDWFTNDPKVTLGPIPATWVAGEPFSVQWETNVVPCTATGGAAGDGWAGTRTQALGSVLVTESVSGTYTFDMDCGSGTQSAHAEVTTTIPPPAVTLKADLANPFVSQFVNLTWSSSVTPCEATGGSGNDTWPHTGLPARSGLVFVENVPGTYTFTITCGAGAQSAQASLPLTFKTIPRPAVTLSASATTAPINTVVTLQWSSTDASTCFASGGFGGGNWSGTLPTSGSKAVTEVFTGVTDYIINCDNATAHTQVTYTSPVSPPTPTPVPAVTLSASSPSQVAGRAVTLTWSSENSSSCAASGGGNGDGWSGNVALSGSQSVTEPNAGPFTYTLTCTGAPPAASAQTTVNFTSPVNTGGGDSGGGGGGGAFTELWLVLLSLLASMRLIAISISPRRRVSV